MEPAVQLDKGFDEYFIFSSVGLGLGLELDFD